jgi:predicted HNH restriction endonuclease
MFVVSKKINRNYYIYLVRSSRDNLSKTPSLKMVAYIGRVENYSEEELNEIKRLARDNSIGIKEFIKELQKKNNQSQIRIKNKNKIINSSGKNCIVCGFNVVVHFHHIIPVFEGGLSTKENIICLCPNHHEMVHKNLISDEELKDYIQQNKIVVGTNNLL